MFTTYGCGYEIAVCCGVGRPADKALAAATALPREPVRFWCGANAFCNSLWLDWMVWEPVDTAHVHGRRRSKRAGRTYLDAPAELPGCQDPLAATVALHLPVDAGDGTRLRAIEIPSDCTVRELLTAVHAFYARRVSLRDLEGGDSRMFAAARKALEQGRTVTWLDLVGRAGYVPACNSLKAAAAFGEGRRPADCGFGFVSFDGLQEDGDGRLVLNLRQALPASRFE